MAKYRRKDTDITAEQWFPGKDVDGVQKYADKGKLYVLGTARGNVFINAGEWVVTESSGLKYVLKPDVFEALYEKTEEQPMN